MARRWLQSLDWLCPGLFVYVTEINITSRLQQEKWTHKRMDTGEQKPLTHVDLFLLLCKKAPKKF